MAAKKTKRKGSLHAPTSSKIQRIEVTSVERLASIQQIKDFLCDQMLIFLEVWFFKLFYMNLDV
jgi:hypothetical protein